MRISGVEMSLGFFNSKASLFSDLSKESWRCPWPLRALILYLYFHKLRILDLSRKLKRENEDEKQNLSFLSPIFPAFKQVVCFRVAYCLLIVSVTNSVDLKHLNRHTQFLIRNLSKSFVNDRIIHLKVAV